MTMRILFDLMKLIREKEVMRILVLDVSLIGLPKTFIPTVPASVCTFPQEGKEDGADS